MFGLLNGVIKYKSLIVNNLCKYWGGGVKYLSSPDYIVDMRLSVIARESLFF